MTNPTPDETLIQLYQRCGMPRRDFRNHNLNHLVLQLLNGSSLLDIGCGVGGLLELANHRGFAVCGLEPNQEFAKITDGRCRKNILSIRAEGLDQLTTQFDNITMLDVLEHIQDDAKVCSMIARRLSPTGQLILTVPALPALYGLRDRFAR